MFVNNSAYQTNLYTPVLHENAQQGETQSKYESKLNELYSRDNNEKKTYDACKGKNKKLNQVEIYTFPRRLAILLLE